MASIGFRQETIRMDTKGQEELLDVVLNAMNDVMYLQDKDYNIVLMNQAGHKFFALTENDLAETKCFRLFGLNKPCLNCPCSEAKKTKKAIRKTFFHTEAQRWMDINVTPSLDAGGEIKNVLVVFRDVSHEKKYQHITDSYGAEMRVLVNRMPLGCVVWDKEFKVVHWNHAAEEIFGFTEEEAIGRHPYEMIVPPEMIPKTDEVKANLLKGDEMAHRQGKNIRKDGREIFCDWTNTPLRDAEGRTRGVLSVVQDVTERMLTEQALKESEAKFRDLFHKHAAVKLLIETQSGQIVDANEAAAEFYGWSVEQLKKMRIDEIRTLSQEEVLSEMKKAANQKRIHFEFKHRLADGSQKDVAVFRSRIAIDGTDFTHSIVQDISEYKKLEAQLLQAQKMESVGRLAGGVAHDINNMLGVMMGHATIALAKLDETDPLYATFSEINNAGQRSAEVTKKLLAFARKQTIAPKVLDLNDALQGMLSMLQRLLGEDIDLVWMPKANLEPVKIDPSQLDQLLMNLCVNARDAIDGIGKLTIETGSVTFDEAYCDKYTGFTPGDFNMLAVSDNGCGIEAETLDNIFEPFFSTKEVGKGTGLGLATVYGIVRQNNGFINVYSEPGQGTTFKIYLPQHKVEVRKKDKADAPRSSRGEGQKILIVEDDSALRFISEKMLSENNYRVFSVGTPREALQVAKEHEGDIDLLITDIVMPEMNGKQLAEAIREMDPEIKILYMSGYTANVISHHGVLEEGVNFIQKPITFNGLAAKVADVLSERQQTS